MVTINSNTVNAFAYMSYYELNGSIGYVALLIACECNVILVCVM